MGESRVTFKTGSQRVQRRGMRSSTRPKSRIGDYLRGKPRAIKAVKVDEARQRNQRLIWAMKWVLILPLSAYIFVWLLLMLVDFFKY
jgi:hypothetical protein